MSEGRDGTPPGSCARTSRWVVLAIAGALLAGYAALAWLNAGAAGFLVNDQGAKFLQVQVLVKSRWRDFTIEYPGQTLDPAGDFSPLKRGGFVRWGDDYVSIYLTPYLLLTSVLYAIWGSPGLYAVSVAAGAATVWLTARLGRSVIDRRVMPLALIAVGLASPLLFYATEFWEHAAAAFLSIAGLALFLSERRFGWFWSGVCWGVGAASRPEGLMFGLAVALSAATLRLRRWPARCAWSSLAAFTVLLPVGVYYRCVSGTWLGPQFLVNYTPGGYSLAAWFQAWLADWPVRMHMLLPSSRPIALALALGLLFILAARVSLRRVYAGVWVAACVWMIVIAALALWAVTQGAYPDDIVASSPVMAFAAVGWLAPRNKGADASFHLRLWWRVVVFYVLLVLLIAPNAGARQWGPRYLLPIFPLLALLSVYALQKMGGIASLLLRVGLAAFAIALAAGVGIQATGLLIAVGRVGNTALVQAVQDAPEPVIIVEEHYIPMLAARTFYQKTWFLVDAPSGLTILLHRLRAQRQADVAVVVADWLEEPLAARLLAEGCRLYEPSPIYAARPPLVMLHAACAGAEGP